MTVKKRIDFIVCGAQKCGTTALDFIMRQHPDIQMATKKELHYFDTEKHFRFPHFGYRKYHQYFDLSSGKIAGEITPIYTYWKKTPKRLYKYSPSLKLIFIYRDPILRAFSHWNMQRKKGIEPLDFFAAIKEEQVRQQASMPLQDQLFSYTDRGRYYQQVSRYKAVFPDNQLLFIKYEDFLNNGQQSVAQICEFIGVSPDFDWENKSVFAGGYSDKPDDDAIALCKVLLSEDTKKLEKELNWDCSDWLSR